MTDAYFKIKGVLQIASFSDILTHEDVMSVLEHEEIVADDLRVMLVYSK